MTTHLTTLCALAALTGACALAGCEQKDAENALENTQETAENTAEKTGDAIADAKRNFIDSVQPQLDRLGEQVTALKERASTVPEAMRPAYESTMTSVDNQWANIKTKFTELKNAGADQWGTLSADFKSMLDRFAQTVTDATQRFTAPAPPPAPSGG